MRGSREEARTRTRTGSGYPETIRSLPSTACVGFMQGVFRPERRENVHTARAEAAPRSTGSNLTQITIIGVGEGGTGERGE